MSLREIIVDCSKGDDLRRFWYLYSHQSHAKNRFVRDILTFLMSRSAQQHGGYVGAGAVINGIPCLPHGLHGIYISRYASIGENCRIYQNVTIGEVCGFAPTIGNGCLIGAGAVIIGGVKIGNDVKIGAGAVVSCDVEDNCTVVSPKQRIIKRGECSDGIAI